MTQVCPCSQSKQGEEMGSFNDAGGEALSNDGCWQGRQLPDGIAPGQGDRWGRGGCRRQQPAEMGRASKLK